MVEFCPRCEKILVPEKRDKLYLVCKNCGFSKVYEGATYKLTERIEEDKRRKTVIIEKKPIHEKIKKEKRELAEEYYEVFLNTFEESAEESE
ncbi:MAG: hypothetical protein QXK12_05280 [Candidatus Nezhaarchaeales archaeon]